MSIGTVIKDLWHGMRHYGFVENIPSSEDKTPRLIPSEKWALGIGIGLTVVLLTATGLNLFIFIGKAIFGLGLFAGSLYALMVAAVFWSARMFRQPTFKKLLFTVLSPVVYLFMTIFGTAAMRRQLTDMQQQGDPNKKVSIPVVLIGVFFTIFAIGGFLWSVRIGYSLIDQMELLVLNLYLIGVAVQSWGSRAYKDGVTLLEFVKSVLWFLGAYGLFRTARAKRRTTPAASPSANPAV